MPTKKTPKIHVRLAAVRKKIKKLGIEPQDMDRAIAWARGH